MYIHLSHGATHYNSKYGGRKENSNEEFSHNHRASNCNLGNRLHRYSDKSLSYEDFSYVNRKYYHCIIV